ncbi:MAG: DUF4203 domain-containing protein [Pirellulales bacterium]|nr:DUF4203 domain-containing protein [Pirellulales bacterium]
MQIINVVLGAILLFFGRALYWVFVGIAGFLLGMTLADQYLDGQSEIIQFLAAVAAGVVGAVIAIYIQRLAFALGGFFAGGYTALSIAAHFGVQTDRSTIWFFLGGILGAIVAATLMDWAIVVLSSLAGAAAIVSEIRIERADALLLFVALTVVGIVVQGRRLARGGTTPGENP